MKEVDLEQHDSASHRYCTKEVTINSTLQHDSTQPTPSTHSKTHVHTDKFCPMCSVLRHIIMKLIIKRKIILINTPIFTTDYTQKMPTQTNKSHTS